MASSPASQSSGMEEWRQVVQSLYPDLGKRTYCVPPVYFNKVSGFKHTVAGQSVIVLQPPGQQVPPPPQPPPQASQASPSQPPQALWTQELQPPAKLAKIHESDTRDDHAQQLVLHCLQKLGEDQQEVMFVLSQLNYGDYLNTPCYTAAAKAAGVHLPRPADLDPQYRRGDFDILLLHRHYGVLVGEIKTVGLNAADLGKTQADADRDVGERVKKAVSQLDKADTVVRHIVSDIKPDISVRKTVILPYVSRRQLQRVLALDPALQQALCASVGGGDAASASQLCLTSGDLSERTSSCNVSGPVLTELRHWWQRRMACIPDPNMSDDVYLDLVTRLCGPATAFPVHCVIPPRVYVRTLGDAVSELGRQLALIVLTQTQLDLLNRAPPNVCLTGPPGTGKTLMQAIKGLLAAREQHLVIVLSLKPTSIAVSRLLHHQLVMTLQADPATQQAAGDVHFLQYDPWSRSEDEEDCLKQIQSLAETAKDRNIQILIDEANFSSGRIGPATQRLVRELQSKYGQRLSLWAATLWNTDIPTELQKERLTVPLRSCPAVVKELVPALLNNKTIHNYTDNGTPSPSDGPRVISIRHQGGKHTKPWPVQCYECGAEIARVLKSELGVGSSVNSTTASPRPLQYWDVLVVTRGTEELAEEKRDDRGQVTSPACDVVRSLRDAGMPVGVIGQRMKDDEERWKQDVKDLGLAVNDRITVAGWEAVQGLERRIVVYLPGRSQTDDERGFSDDQVQAVNKVLLLSRCTTQLVIVDVPRDGDNSPDGGASEGEA